VAVPKVLAGAGDADNVSVTLKPMSLAFFGGAGLLAVYGIVAQSAAALVLAAFVALAGAGGASFREGSIQFSGQRSGMLFLIGMLIAIPALVIA
jgi:hypothetical protein